MDKKYEDYLNADSETEKKTLAEKYFKEDGLHFLEEVEIHKELESHFDPVDVRNRCSISIKDQENSIDSSQLTSRVMSTINDKNKGRRWIKILAAAAVIIVSFIVISHFKGPASFGKQTQYLSTSGAIKSELNNIFTGEGTITFEDGVIVETLEESKIEIDKNSHDRLRLISGKIKVSVDPENRRGTQEYSLPFVKLKVLGTKFTMESAEKSSSVEVLKGKVEASSTSDQILILKGQKYEFTASYAKRVYALRGAVFQFYFDKLNEKLSYKIKPEFTDGVVGNALVFDGQQQIAIDKGLQNLGETITLWFKADYSDKTMALLNIDSGNVSSAFSLFLNGNELNFTIAENNYTYSIMPGKWNHIALARDKKGLARLFLNGKVRETVNFNYLVDTNTKILNIGFSKDKGLSSFKGLLDELNIFHSFLKKKNVDVLYESGKPFQ